MTTRRVLPLAAVVALLMAGAALASGFFPPEDATLTPVGDKDVAHWLGPEPVVPGAFNVSAEIEAGKSATLWFGVQKYAAGSPNATQAAWVNVTSDTLALNASLFIESDLMTSNVWDFANVTFETTNATPETNAYAFTVEVYSILPAEDENATANVTLVASGSGAGTVRVTAVPIPTPPEEPGIPTTYLVVGGAAVVVLGGAGVIAMQRRRERARMNRAPRRSAALREEALERAAMKKPEERAAVQAEIRQQEQVRERRRELQILDAKKADALKSIELLRKRHESGGLTKLQFDTMVAKKQADLERIEAEIADMEAREGGGASAA